MIQPAAHVAAARRANHDRHGDAPAAAVPQRGRLVDDLIEPAADEVGELHFGDRAVAALRCADADADNRRLRNRGIETACFAEFVGNALRDAERPAVRPDVFAEHEHFRIAPHLFDQRFPNGLEI